MPCYARLAGGLLTAVVSLQVSAQEPARDSIAPPRPDTIYRRETSHEYMLGTFGPRPILRATALAGFDQWRGRPSELPRDRRGFQDRLGARVGQVAISHTLRSGFARIVDQRPLRFHLCGCEGTRARLAYAIESPLRVATLNGPALSALNPVTELVSGVLVTSVRPGGLSVGSGAVAGITGIAGEAAWSVVREFWPWKWRPPFL